MIDLVGKPFYLSEEDISWVIKTKSEMSIDEKIGQLFCPIGMSNELSYLDENLLKYNIGGILYRNGIAEEMQETHRYLQQKSKIPMFIAANLEAGGDGIAIDGTSFGKQMQVAATGDSKHAYRLGIVSCSEGAAVGCNWTFAPVVDIDMNFRNPITNIRTYGSNKYTVIDMSKEYMKAAKECDVAVSIKHFPGDGVDEVDQHLLTSVNSLSCEEWDKTYGVVYEELIDEGALTVMIGHIAMPAYQRYFNPNFQDKIMPATLSKEITNDLLRKKLGFNGLIVTDATPMVGFTAAMERKKAVPYSIACGCDIFLFNKDLKEDYIFMKKGYEEGIISDERLDEAITRILATKAALKLHKKQKNNCLVPDKKSLAIIGCEKHKTWAYECADEAATLIKDTQELLPISPKKHKRVLLEILGDFPSNERVEGKITELLTKEGFEIIPYKKEDFTMPIDNVSDIKRKYDLVLYIANIENASNKTASRINWYTFFGLGNNLPWFVEEVPTLFVSVGNPYHLLDVPMIKTFVNCYSNHNIMLETVVEKLLGRSAWKGTSPVDSFCGKEYLKY
ncbi:MULTISPECIES: glycoside hydrolase family 3 protein [unclassified Clostridium]|uniref:glycoside hydrolase family 3 protein n=1 Tax=unclassified Clostridium TaxID=2614128 RepID=UPI001EED50D2|nr:MULTISPECIES: glycoside hydrolase family 3 N-terminal domain-containing protein [unclassified Clostridium]